MSTLQTQQHISYTFEIHRDTRQTSTSIFNYIYVKFYKNKTKYIPKNITNTDKRGSNKKYGVTSTIQYKKERKKQVIRLLILLNKLD